MYFKFVDDFMKLIDELKNRFQLLNAKTAEHLTLNTN